MFQRYNVIQNIDGTGLTIFFRQKAEKILGFLHLKLQKQIFGRFAMIVFIQLLLVGCIPVDDKIPKEDAQSQIYYAADFKAKKCGTPIPSPPLLVFTDQLQRNLDLCTIAITRLECPFSEYPIICLGIYSPEPIPEIPWYIDFKELTNRRIKF